MRHMIGASGEAALVPGVQDVEHQRRVDANGRMQASRRLPGAKPDAGDVFAVGASRVQRDNDAADTDGVARACQPPHLDLDPLQGRVHETDRAAWAPLFAQYVPWLQRLAQFKVYVPDFEVAQLRIAKLKVPRAPFAFYRVAAGLQILDDLLQVAPNKMRQHPAVVNVCAPADQAVAVGLVPESCDERAPKQLLG